MGFLAEVGRLASIPLASKKWLAYQIAAQTIALMFFAELWLTKSFAEVHNNVALGGVFTLLYLTIVSKVAVDGTYLFGQAWIDRYSGVINQVLHRDKEGTVTSEKTEAAVGESAPEPVAAKPAIPAVVPKVEVSAENVVVTERETGE